MKLDTKLRLNSLAVIFLVVIFVGFSFFLTVSLGRAYQKQQLAQKLTEASYQMALLRNDYFNYQNLRSKEQSTSAHESLEELLAEAGTKFSRPKEQLLLQEINGVTAASKDLFEKLVTTIEQGGSKTVIQELINQLSIKSQTRVSKISRLAQISRQQAVAAEQGFMLTVIVLGAIAVAGTLWSYTTGKRIFYALEQAKAKDKAILMNLGEGIAVTDETGKLILFNKAADDITGIGMITDTPNVWQEKYGIFYADTMEPLPTNQMPLVMAARGERVSDVQMFIKNSKVPEGKFISVTATPVVMDNGEKIGGVAIFRDTTKEKEIDKAKTEFLSQASHQLKTPLSILWWYAKALLNHTGTMQNANPYIVEIIKSTERMTHLVQNLLNISKLDMGVHLLKLKPINIRQCIQKELGALEPVITQKSIRIELNYTLPEKFTVVLDAEQISAVLNNIISNALHYTSQHGSIFINVSLEKKGLLIRVTDTGIGVAQAALGHLGEKFYRADNAKAAYTEGTGLGLYIARSTLKNLGGYLEIKSPAPELEKLKIKVNFPGTSCYIYLPDSDISEQSV